VVERRAFIAAAERDRRINPEGKLKLVKSVGSCAAGGTLSRASRRLQKDGNRRAAISLPLSRARDIKKEAVAYPATLLNESFVELNERWW